ncbi:hypothetical protein ABZZ36_43820 [Actinacidiphila glaucinigra]|uniref:hypothetical protein n=1 Tax=Actinacidiphila glaucinigra TaxID=235986 RepID=UPI0033BF754F
MKRRPPHAGASAPTAADGIAQCEDFLSWHAEISDAQAAARGYADHMPWLTTSQRHEVVRLYVADRVSLVREMRTRITERNSTLHSEYSRRYDALRNQLLCRVVAVALVTATICIPVPLLVLFTGD